jgi:hypothetical protein
MKKLLTSPEPLAFARAFALAAFASLACVAFGPTSAKTHAPRAPGLDPNQSAPRPGPSHGAREPHPLDALDREVQKRFHDVIGFGMARIATERRFEPETPGEREAVRELKRGGYRVGLYLAGRRVLEPMPEEPRLRVKTTFGSGFGGHGFSGPIFLSSSAITKVPSATALWGETRLALLSFAEGAERYGFEAGGWEVEARPVRASGESCLRCHNTDYRTVRGVTGRGVVFSKTEPKGNALKVGDPLGVLVYVYKRSR